VLLHQLAHDLCGGRWLALGGGGYAVLDVVPRTWSHLVAVAAHAPVDPASLVPAAWRDHVRSRFGRPGPALMGDARSGPGAVSGGLPAWRSWASGADPADPVDRAVLATRRAVFPLLGLDPWFD
jgi:acetoin utilization protein AcuC